MANGRVGKTVTVDSSTTQLKDGTAEGRTTVLTEVGWSDTPGDFDTSDFEPDGKTAPTEEPIPGSPESF